METNEKGKPEAPNPPLSSLDDLIERGSQPEPAAQTAEDQAEEKKMQDMLDATLGEIGDGTIRNPGA